MFICLVHVCIPLMPLQSCCSTRKRCETSSRRRRRCTAAEAQNYSTRRQKGYEEIIEGCSGEEEAGKVTGQPSGGGQVVCSGEDFATRNSERDVVHRQESARRRGRRSATGKTTEDCRARTIASRCIYPMFNCSAPGVQLYYVCSD